MPRPIEHPLTLAGKELNTDRELPRIEKRETRKIRETAIEGTIRKVRDINITGLFNRHPKAYSFAQKACGVSPRKFIQRLSLGLSYVLNHQSPGQNIYNLRTDALRSNNLCLVKPEEKTAIQDNSAKIILIYEIGKLVSKGLLSSSHSSVNSTSKNEPASTTIINKNYSEIIYNLIRDIIRLQQKMIEQIEKEAQEQREADRLAEKKHLEKREEARALTKSLERKIILKRITLSRLIRQSLLESDNDKREQLDRLIGILTDEATTLETSKGSLLKKAA
ncbi:MAG: hypothetical protein ABIH50_01310 [bacterium]